MLALIDKCMFFLLTAPAVVRAAWRLRRLESRQRLDVLVDEMRRVPRFRLGYFMAPQRLAACTDRWLALWGKWVVRKPYRGRCLDRSLLLLDLWTRCGLRPNLHLGSVKSAEERQFHAWVSVPDGPSSGASPHREIWAA